MTGASRPSPVASGQSHTGGSPGFVFAVVALMLAVPILAHGCHTGDHDDEPAFAPPREMTKNPPMTHQ